MIQPVILSGGAGTRLWPLSRELYPKQLLPLLSDKTMLQETVGRLEGLQTSGAPMIVCNEAHRFMVAEQLRQQEVAPSAIILEPCGRNTAPAIAIAAMQAQQNGDDSILLVLPADHLIADVVSFRKAVLAGAELAEIGKLVTFGIVPDHPETGYGYIKAKNSISPKSFQASSVAEFVEKPDLATAEQYVASGNYYWNSGMFMFKASTYLLELNHYRPDIFNACQAAFDAITTDLDFHRLDNDYFSACPSESIDYAVMEKTMKAVVFPLSVGWNDIGSWAALWDVREKDSVGNVVFGDVLIEQVENCYLHSSRRLVAAVGVQNLVVVETPDAVLVAQKDRVQEVKGIVRQLKAQQRSEADFHHRVNRPWGAYEGIDFGERFQVKRITVDAGAQLSLQKHHHRAEHWVVVRGTAKVTCGEKTFLLTENQSTYIPLGEVHRLGNPGQIPLEIIEVQSGSYLGEDDIIRLEDNYGRNDIEKGKV